jgi:site-specific DNA recombinase
MTTKCPESLVAIGYSRVSTLLQGQEGDGLGVQKDRMASWCRYSGIDLVEVHEDAGLSGTSMDHRPGLRTALRSCLRRGAGTVLVVYKLDRLGRNALDVQEVLALLLDSGVRVVSLVEGIDSGSGMGAMLLKLLTSILATFAELERETIRTRLLDGRQRADRENRPYASEPRYGRRVDHVDPSRLVLDDAEAHAVQRIHELRNAGFSYRAIAALLDEEGLRPRRAPFWNHAVVARIATGRRTTRRTSVAKTLSQ